MSDDSNFWQQQAQQNLLIASNASAAGASRALADANHAGIVAQNARLDEFEANRENKD